MTVEAKTQGLCKIHNARFYNLAPRAINSMAYNREMPWLAITRFVNHLAHQNSLMITDCNSFSLFSTETMPRLKSGTFNMHHIYSKR